MFALAALTTVFQICIINVLNLYIYYICLLFIFTFSTFKVIFQNYKMHGQNEFFVKLLYFTRVSFDFGVIIPSQMPMTFS